MEDLSWARVKELLEKWQPKVVDKITGAAADVNKYPYALNNEETLAQLLANLNFFAVSLGEWQARYKRLDLWCDKRYEIEKGLETVRIVKEGKATNYAQSAKYEKVQEYLDIMVNASAMHMRVQNARAASRDTAEAIRSRISQIKGARRSS